MGLLTDPSSEQGRATKLLLRFHTKISVLLYLTGVIWFCSLAYPSMNASTYFSENALLPGLVTSEFNEAAAAERFLKDLHDEMVRYPDSVPYSWLLAKFEQIGLDTYTHNFTLNSPLKLNEKYTGKNVYGILRAPRGSSTESVILSIPYRPPSSVHETTAPSIALMLAFAKQARRKNYWAKDIIFLITEHEQLGMQAWLEAYHGVSRGDEGVLDHGDLRGRAGAIQAAINLEIHDKNVGQMDIKIEGLNGQLPNLDLFNLATKMCIKEGVVNTFKGRTTEFYTEPFDIWLSYFRTLMSMVLTQATGIPNGNHGLFLPFGIQAVTMEGFAEQKFRGSRVSFTGMGRALEGIFRSLNNLLERFHQSFFFYLLPSADRYISIGLYMPAVSLIAAAAIIKACAKWCKLQYPDKNEKEEDDDVSMVNILALLVLAHLCGMMLNYGPQYLIPICEYYDIPTSTGIPVALFSFCLLSLFMSLMVGFRSCSKSMTMLSIFSLLEFGTVLICTSMTNFSLGMICATLWTPMVLLINPTTCVYYRFVQRLYWLLLHPVMILFVVVLVNTFSMFTGEKVMENVKRGVDATSQAVVYSIVDSMVYGNWMYTLVTTILIPTWLCFWCVSFSSCKKPQPAKIYASEKQKPTADKKDQQKPVKSKKSEEKKAAKVKKTN